VHRFLWAFTARCFSDAKSTKQLDCCNHTKKNLSNLCSTCLQATIIIPCRFCIIISYVCLTLFLEWLDVLAAWQESGLACEKNSVSAMPLIFVNSFTRCQHLFPWTSWAVLLLLPIEQNKLTMAWRGPYKVVGTVGEVDYKIEINPGKMKTCWNDIFTVKMSKRTFYAM